MRRLLEYDDVLIMPRPSKVNSRDAVSVATTLPTINDKRVLRLEVPVIASPMKGIVGVDLIIRLGKLGGIGILHRFHSDEDGNPDFKERLAEIMLLEVAKVKYGIAVGCRKPEDTEIIDKICSGILTPDIVCIDVANGYTSTVKSFANDLYRKFKENKVRTSLMAGNVVSVEGVRGLSKNGVSLSRIGIGSGQLCTTRNKTGIGYPQLSALQELKGYWWGLIADGGIKTTGDIVKALGAGADAVMLGSMFAKAFESESNGQIYGMASKELQENFYGSTKSVEGVSKEVKKEISLADLIKDITWSIKSACTYVDAVNLAQLRQNTVFVRVGAHSIVEKEDIYVPD